MMNRRDVLQGLVLLGVPKGQPTQTNEWGAAVCLTDLVRLVANSIRIEMSKAQWLAVNSLVTMARTEDMPCAVGQLSTLPITVNERVPKDEIWVVAHDGTVMSKLTQLAIPTSER